MYFTASGHLLTCHDYGLIEEAAAFDAMPLLQIRQIHAGTKAAVTLHELTLQVLNETDIGALRDWLSSRRGRGARQRRSSISGSREKPTARPRRVCI